MVKNYTKWYFLEPFLNTKEKLHLNDISRRLEKPHPLVRRYLNDFYEEGVLKKEQSGKQVYYSLNKEHSLITEILSIAEKEKLIRLSEKSLVLKEFLSKIHKISSQPCLIFGSFSLENKKHKKKSKDIDLLIVGKMSKKKKEEIENLGGRLNKEVHLININSLDEISETLKKEIFSKHLIINNSEFFIEWLH